MCVDLDYSRATVGLRRLALGLCAFVTMAHGFAQNPDLPFTSASTGADGPLRLSLPAGLPTARGRSAAAYDPERQRILVHGGSAPTGRLYNSETWSWDGTNWMLLTTNGPTLASASMAYDPRNRQMVLYGGYDGTDWRDTTYVWNGSGWELRSPSVRPRASQGGSKRMVFDEARQQVVLFGDARFNDTYTWDGTNWTLVVPSQSPPPHNASTLAYDSARQEIILFGGWRNDRGLNDTWTWDGKDWTRKNPVTSPPPRGEASMAYDPTRQRMVLHGGYDLIDGRYVYFDDTWVWDGTDWSRAESPRGPLPRYGSQMVHDPARQQMVLIGGWYKQHGFNGSWTWNGSTWTPQSGDTYVFDMSAKSDGVWNFTTIEVPAGLYVYFSRNAANTPVRWLASGDVRIDGGLILNGEGGDARLPVSVPARGGPGGYDGGLGGVPAGQGPSLLGTAGGGPGGGLPANIPNTTSITGGNGRHTGNAYLQPLFGGSGGGGTAVNRGVRGARGSGGGGAILISSSRDIVIRGYISANSGEGERPGDANSPTSGGLGSGGAIRLQADRIAVPGGLYAQAGTGNEAARGIVRLESYYRTITGSVPPDTHYSAPVVSSEADRPISRVRITQVAGLPVTEPPSGDLRNPDVLFAADGEVTVTIAGEGLPDGTPVRLRLIASTGVLIETPAADQPAIRLSGGTASVVVNVPRGAATLQAFAEVAASAR